MRKYVSWIVGAILIIVALLVPNGGISAIAGAGTGSGAKITKVKQVGELLAGFSQKAGVSPIVDKVSTPSIEAIKAQASKEEYQSVTLSIDTTASTTSNSSYSRGSAAASSDIKRSMTCYFTETEAFYVVDATINSRSSSSYYGDEYNSAYNHETSLALSVAFELYIGEEEQLLKITRWGTKYSTNNEDDEDNDSYLIPTGGINKWMDVAEFGDVVLSVNAFNYEILTIFGEYILDVGTDKFVQSGNRYSLKSSNAKELCTQICGLEKGFEEAEFSVDLSNAQNPYVNFLYTVDFSNHSEGYNATYYGGEWTTISLSNVNNTVINFPEDVTVYSMEDFE